MFPRFYIPKVLCSDMVLYSEISGSIFQRFYIPKYKVLYSEDFIYIPRTGDITFDESATYKLYKCT